MTSSSTSTQVTKSSSVVKRGIRIAQWRDLPALSQVIARSFNTNDLFGDLMHPHRHEYPEDWARYWLRTFQADYFERGYVFLAATETNEDGEEVIVGVAEWERIGECSVHTDIEGDQGRGRQSTWWDPKPYVFPSIIRWYTTISNWFHPSRAISPNKSIQNILDDSWPFMSHYWMDQPTTPPPTTSTPKASTLISTILSKLLLINSNDVQGKEKKNWYLNFLAIDPAHQGKSHGQNMVNWGMRRAQIENEIQDQDQDRDQTRNQTESDNNSKPNGASEHEADASVSVSVICAKGTLPFYQRCGFTTFAGDVKAAGTGKYSGKLNPFGKGGVGEHVQGGEVLFRYFGPRVVTSSTGVVGVGVGDGENNSVHTRWTEEGEVVVGKDDLGRESGRNGGKGRAVHVEVEEIQT